jgi:hypothetical protein
MLKDLVSYIYIRTAGKNILTSMACLDLWHRLPSLYKMITVELGYLLT